VVFVEVGEQTQVDRLPAKQLPGLRVSAPIAFTVAPEASERAKPVTSFPALISSGTTADPMWPLAPVTKTRMNVGAGEPQGLAA